MERYRRIDVQDSETKSGSAMKPKFISGGGYAGQYYNNRPAHHNSSSVDQAR